MLNITFEIGIRRKHLFISNFCRYISVNMGRRRAGIRKRLERKRDPNPNEESVERPPQKPYYDLVKENELFDKYYKGMGICAAEIWDNFIEVLKTPLPSSFRITPGSAKGVAQTMIELVQNQFQDIKALPWYPDKLAWQMELTRKDIRRSETYYKLHNFLISETENGTISRQETVSMIPPLVLKVESHHKVLDMCAAPGSKTAQLLEFLHAQSDEIPTGFVVANDIDNKRCYMLVHQAKRLNSPCLAVINHDSGILPNLYEPDGQQLQFDRVLCDVPCSGDGTLRKNPDIWAKWTPANAINLHGVQSRILRRSVELLRIGGRIAYSTCSMNPVENEAVVHRLLAQTLGALQLVDISADLPGLVYSKGMNEWKVASRNVEFYEKWEDVDEKWRTTLRPQMFPPSEEDRDKFHLERCIRILPHHQNTGAFFVAVLEKIKPIKESEKRPTAAEKKAANDSAKQHKRRKLGFREDPFIFFKDDEEIWPPMKDFYEINEIFDPKCLLVRCLVGKKKNIYLASSQIRQMLLKNQETVKFINTGVKAFVRSDNRNMKRCPFRISNDALENIFKFLGPSRIVAISKPDLLQLLQNDNPLESPLLTSVSTELQARCESMDAGSCVLHYKSAETDQSGNPALELRVSGWRGTKTLRVYMPQCNVVHLLRLLGGDISKYDINKFSKIEGNTEETEEAAESEEIKIDDSEEIKPT